MLRLAPRRRLGRLVGLLRLGVALSGLLVARRGTLLRSRVALRRRLRVARGGRRLRGGLRLRESVGVVRALLRRRGGGLVLLLRRRLRRLLLLGLGVPIPAAPGLRRFPLDGRGRVAAPPRLRRGYSVESRSGRGRELDIPRRHDKARTNGHILHSAAYGSCGRGGAGAAGACCGGACWYCC